VSQEWCFGRWKHSFIALGLRESDYYQLSMLVVMLKRDGIIPPWFHSGYSVRHFSHHAPEEVTVALLISTRRKKLLWAFNRAPGSTAQMVVRYNHWPTNLHRKVAHPFKMSDFFFQMVLKPRRFKGVRESMARFQARTIKRQTRHGQLY
jgi:hypothetical protein